ncbi:MULTISPECIES: hypothetical protein [Streptomyces]|uniref:Holin n=1 Tax=Streptomyces dengpaensis TaxID=2049881 RepID=A0ABN5I7Y5_9ACTN|nr:MULTISPECIES: hypothetical protein [Streptomyces]AVH58372.1 hypothetical protein C4B68_24325 [Streptomyces dengpaensis]PIB06047.1 hypothetical protein B1C81_26045 [Streptomyces sp. HG99]
MSPAAKRTARTVLQTLLSLAAVLPALVDTDGIAEALPWLATAAAGAGALARIMAMPAVERLLDRLGLGLVDNDGSPSA